MRSSTSSTLESWSWGTSVRLAPTMYYTENREHEFSWDSDLFSAVL